MFVHVVCLHGCFSNEGVPPEATKGAKADGIEFLYGINMYDPSQSIQQRTERRSLCATGKLTRSESARPSRFVRPNLKERPSTASDDLSMPSSIGRYGMPIFNASDNSDVEPTKLMKLVKRRKTQERKLRFNEVQVARIQEKLSTFCTHTEWVRKLRQPFKQIKVVDGM